MRRLTLISLLVGALVSGCATTSVDRVKDLSSAGVAYTKATAAVIDLAIDSSIDVSSQRRVLAKPRPPLSETDQNDRERELKGLDNELILSTTKYTRLKRSVNGLEAYFVALQNLADGSTAEATETAVKSLADHMNGINAALDQTPGGKPLISDDRKTAIGNLGKLVTNQVHGTVLAKALERDAAVVGRALALQQIVLKDAADDIRVGLNEADARFYVQRVLGPYKTGQIDDGWVSDRRAYIKVRALGSAVETASSAEAAAKQMQIVWARVLAGEYSAREVISMLKDTEDLLSAVATLKEANAKK